jgi:hypothetical protein
MAGKSTVVRQIGEKQIFPDVKNLTTSAISYNQGQTLCFDSVTNLVRACTAQADSNNFLGIAALDVSSGKPLSPYQGTAVDASQAVPSMNGPLYGDTFLMTIKTGDSLTPGQDVYLYPSAGYNGVASSAGVAATGINPIGVYVGTQGTVSSAAASTQVECLIGARFPNNILKF